jgi:hypothetical protein
VTSKEWVTTRGVTIGHPLFSARLELTVVHGVVSGMSGTSVGSRLKIQSSGPVGEALTSTYIGGKGREVEVICNRRMTVCLAQYGDDVAIGEILFCYL